MKIWLDGCLFDVPDDVAAECEKAEYWEFFYPDQRARLALKYLLQLHFPDRFTYPSLPPPDDEPKERARVVAGALE